MTKRTLFTDIRDWIKPPPVYKTAADYELELRVLRAEEAVANSAQRNRERIYVPPRECSLPHPDLDRPFIYSPALKMKIQECPRCGQCMGVAA